MIKNLKNITKFVRHKRNSLVNFAFHKSYLFNIESKFPWESLITNYNYKEFKKIV